MAEAQPPRNIVRAAPGATPARAMPEMSAPPDPARAAEWTFKRLVRYIQQFEANLDPDQEIGGRMVSFGDVVQFSIMNVGYWNPDIITFDGVDKQGRAIKLIQHVSQLNVLLIAAAKLNPAEAPRRIGFKLDKDAT